MNQVVIDYLMIRFNSLSYQEKMVIISNLKPEFILAIDKLIPEMPFISELAMNIRDARYVAPTAESYSAWAENYLKNK
jgi:hypothetical protein